MAAPSTSAAAEAAIRVSGAIAIPTALGLGEDRFVTIRERVRGALRHEALNFFLTNRLPRRQASRLIGWFSGLEQPFVSTLSIKVWTYFADVDFSDSAESSFPSLRAAFTRAPRPGARPIDRSNDVIVSPCDAIVGACGKVADGQAYQIKGSYYGLNTLLGECEDIGEFRNGRFVTLRLTAGMYHRFHAPDDLLVRSVSYITGDRWNVNPPALKRVAKLYCRNERAIVRAVLSPGDVPMLIVPVAAILVAGIRLRFIDTPSLIRGGSRHAACSVALARGEEMGWFEHGSTIILFVPGQYDLERGVGQGSRIRLGERLLRRR